MFFFLFFNNIWLKILNLYIYWSLISCSPNAHSLGLRGLPTFPLRKDGVDFAVGLCSLFQSCSQNKLPAFI